MDIEHARLLASSVDGQAEKQARSDTSADVGPFDLLKYTRTRSQAVMSRTRHRLINRVR